MTKPPETRNRMGSKLLGRELRLRRGNRSRNEMARLSNSPPLAGRVIPVSASLIHKFETGVRMPSVETLRTLSMLYGMTVEHMFRLIEAERLAEQEPEGTTFDELMEESKAAILLGDYQSAFPAALRACELAESPQGLFQATGNKAMCLWKLGMPREAANLLLDILDTSGIEPEHLANVYYSIASIFRSLQQLTPAEDFARRGLEKIPSALKSKSKVAAAIQSTLGNLLADTAEQTPADAKKLCREAIRLYEQAREIMRQLDESALAAVVLANIGAAHRIEGNRILAFERLQAALRECRECEYQRGIAYALKELGRTYLEANEWIKAKQNLVQAESIASRAGYADLQFQTLVHLAEGARNNDEPFEPMIRRLQGLLPFLEDRFPERERFEAYLRDEASLAGGIS